MHVFVGLERKYSKQKCTRTCTHTHAQTCTHINTRTHAHTHARTYIYNTNITFFEMASARVSITALVSSAPPADKSPSAPRAVLVTV